jgi:hypothetical protein
MDIVTVSPQQELVIPRSVCESCGFSRGSARTPSAIAAAWS